MKIKCAICEKDFKQITFTHLKKHNMTIEKYKEKFPNSPIVSEDVSKVLSQKCKKQNQNENFGFKNGHKINLNKEPWNKGETKETDERIAKYSGKLEGKEVSYETRIKQSKRMKQYHKEHPDALKGEKNGMYGKKLSPEHLKALWSIGQKINNVEKQAYRTLMQYGFEYVGDRQFWLTFKDGTHKCPDFIAKSIKTAIEVYGDYWHKNDDPNDIINKYKEIGWDCYVLWEHEIMKDGFCPEYFEQALGIFEEEEFTYDDFNGKWML